MPIDNGILELVGFLIAIVALIVIVIFLAKGGSGGEEKEGGEKSGSGWIFLLVGIVVLMIMIGLVWVTQNPGVDPLTTHGAGGAVIAKTVGAAAVSTTSASTTSASTTSESVGAKIKRSDLRCFARVIPRTVNRKTTVAQPELDPFTPQQVGSVYLGSIPFDGTGKKIGIVTCYAYSKLQSDFNTFTSTYGLRSKTLHIHNLGSQQDSGWAVETCLDTQWSHVFAPGAETHVFAAKDSSFTSLQAAIQAAINAGMNIVSMSLGSDEYQSVIQSMDPLFSSNPQIIFLAASGDSDTVSYPSSSANVISIGGTVLSVADDGKNNSRVPVVDRTPITVGAYTKIGECDWYSPDGSGSGHGTSAYIPRPAYQNGHNQSATRSTPDYSTMSATTNGNGVSIYCSAIGGWIGVEGTSIGAPAEAGRLASVQAARAALSKTPLTRLQILTYFYSLAPPTLPLDMMADGAGYVNSRTMQALVSL